MSPLRSNPALSATSAGPAEAVSTREHIAEYDERGNAFCRACEAEQADPRIWMEPGDVAELTFETGETIVGLWTRPRGTHAGWVLTDGTRLRARPRTLVHIRIVYPPDRIAEESVTHDDHTTEHPTD